MPYLLDTNVLLRFAHRADPQHALIRGAVSRLVARGEALHVVPQNLYELWVVATRPGTARGGLGLTPQQAHRTLRLTERLFTLLPDTPDVYARWRDLVLTAGVSGAPAHDARLVAAMRTHGLTHLLTMNTGDFARYGAAPWNLVVVDPASV